MGRRNPNGYGSVTKLKGNRSRPWMVRATVYDEEGNAKQVPVGYAETEAAAKILQAEYNNNPWSIDRERVKLSDLYQRWLEIKCPKLGESSQRNLKSAYRHCSKYYGVKYRSLRAYQMQDCIDNCGCGYSTQAAIKNLWGHLDRFAFELDIISKKYSELLTSDPVPDTSRTPFTHEQVSALWEIQSEDWVNTVLIFLYTGFRLTELLGMKTEQVNTQNWYFEGGIKSAAGKCRIVPIHKRIRPLVQALVEHENVYLFTYTTGKKFTTTTYYNNCWKPVMEKIGADKTPHEARHTFETFLDDAKANRKCIDMLMGHKSKDVGNRVYNHKTIEQLRETVELLV